MKDKKKIRVAYIFINGIHEDGLWCMSIMLKTHDVLCHVCGFDINGEIHSASGFPDSRQKQKDVAAPFNMYV